MSTIYALVDPTNNQPFYVGVTSRDLARRLYEHIAYQGTGTSAKKERIAALKALGLLPLIVALFEVSKAAAFGVETICINLMSKSCGLLQNPRNANLRRTASKVNIRLA